MNINELQRQGSQDTCILDNSLRKKGRLWYRRSLKESDDKRRQNSGTLPRAWKQTKQCNSNSLIDYSDPQRTSVVLEKQDNDTYGFEIQTYGLPQKSSASSVALEMCTFVCMVQENSAAETAGLTTGDVIISVNGASIEGLSHQHIVDLIRDSTNSLKMETICGTVVKRIELDKKMSLLKQKLREKRVELQALTLQEKRLMRGNLNGSSLHPSLESQASLDSLTSHGQRFSSDSSYRSVMTEDSDQASSVFGDLNSPSSYGTVGTTDDSLFFSTDFPNEERPGGQIIFSPIGPHHILGRSRTCDSSLAGSSSSLSSPTWDETRASTLFGTLPRKNRRGTVRKHILKLIPGFNRSVEEEELRPNEMEMK